MLTYEHPDCIIPAICSQPRVTPTGLTRGHRPEGREAGIPGATPTHQADLTRRSVNADAWSHGYRGLSPFFASRRWRSRTASAYCSNDVRPRPTGAGVGRGGVDPAVMTGGSSCVRSSAFAISSLRTRSQFIFVMSPPPRRASRRTTSSARAHAARTHPGSPERRTCGPLPTSTPGSR